MARNARILCALKRREMFLGVRNFLRFKFTSKTFHRQQNFSGTCFTFNQHFWQRLAEKFGLLLLRVGGWNLHAIKIFNSADFPTEALVMAAKLHSRASTYSLAKPILGRFFINAQNVTHLMTSTKFIHTKGLIKQKKSISDVIEWRNCAVGAILV